MQEYVTNVDLYVLAETEDEARELTEKLLTEVFEQPEVVAVNAAFPPELCGEFT